MRVCASLTPGFCMIAQARFRTFAALLLPVNEPHGPRRPGHLPAENLELMPQDQQLEVLQAAGGRRESEDFVAAVCGALA